MYHQEPKTFVVTRQIRDKKEVKTVVAVTALKAITQLGWTSSVIISAYADPILTHYQLS